MVTLPQKRLRSDSTEADVKTVFATGLFDRAPELADQHSKSGPYQHCIIDGLVNDGLLRRVRKEIMSELHFTPKETDIYKLLQTGDLLNISGLPVAEKQKLSGLQTLRDAMYSSEFREFVAKVCDCGPLSGTKQDMSINCYVKGSHLLTHDDVIGSRRVSYILYLPDVETCDYKDESGKLTGWDPKWGGALRLYEIMAKGIPKTEWSKVISPVWNQLAFFVVLPGASFHDVEEVVVDKERLAISGWFHLPQEGEDGYVEGLQERLNLESSRSALADAQAATKSGLGELPVPVLDKLEPTDRTVVNNEPSAAELDLIMRVANDQTYMSTKPTVSASESELLKESMFGDMKLNLLTDKEHAYLAQFMNEKYINGIDMIDQQSEFLEESKLKLLDFLNKEMAAKVQAYISEQEEKQVPFSMHEVKKYAPGWTISRPPHKHRYMYLTPDTEESNAVQEVTKFLASREFRKWLRLITNLSDFSHGRVLGRRFRPGLDYTLATSSLHRSDGPDGGKNDAGLLEATLSITPTPGWGDGEFGGYELYMAGKSDDSDDNDPAVYLGGGGNKRQKTDDSSEEESEDDSDDQEEDDAVLLTSQARWNVFTLVYRDTDVLKFVKYVSQNAPGSRWDVTGEWQSVVEE
ncbi:Oxoglutarate and iron-dependent oxygenase degradation C-term-domain-containing protein [Lipomyces arxii]|uniref:Oxoglutarate and iron-dependent oxygenase degradation C-term-domain-containing protein n=1 Tax=Lipomyces arxii TaxID=56418 RepID=UPI0034CFD717